MRHDVIAAEENCSSFGCGSRCGEISQSRSVLSTLSCNRLLLATIGLPTVLTEKPGHVTNAKGARIEARYGEGIAVPPQENFWCLRYRNGVI